MCIRDRHIDVQTVQQSDQCHDSRCDPGDPPDTSAAVIIPGYRKIDSYQQSLGHQPHIPAGIPCICQDWDKKNFIFFCTYSIKSLLIFKVQNSLLLLTFSLLPIEEASSFFTTGFLYYSFCLLHCISDKVLTLKHNLYVFVVVNEHLINYVGKYISVILFQHTILG